MRPATLLGAALVALGAGACASAAREMAGQDKTTATYGGTVPAAREGIAPAESVSGEVKAGEPSAAKPSRQAGVTAADSVVKVTDQPAAEETRTFGALDTSAWPSESRDAAEGMIRRYGPPTITSADQVSWSNAGPFKRVVVRRLEDSDSSANVIELVLVSPVPDSLVGVLEELDAGLEVNAAGGEIIVQCDRAELCFLGLNVARDIVSGRSTLDEAREEYQRCVSAVRVGAAVPCPPERLRFDNAAPEEPRDP